MTQPQARQRRTMSPQLPDCLPLSRATTATPPPRRGVHHSIAFWIGTALGLAIGNLIILAAMHQPLPSRPASQAPGQLNYTVEVLP